MKRSIKDNIAFTLVELLVVIAIISILMALLSPSLKRARDKALQIQCMNNQKQIVMALILYAGDNSGVLPPWGDSTFTFSRYWNYLVSPYLGKPGKLAGIDYLVCPSTKAPQYGVNLGGPFGIEGNALFPRSKNLADVKPSTILTADVLSSKAFYNPKAYPFTTEQGGYGFNDSWGSSRFNLFDPRHNSQGVCCFGDGHVKAVPILDFLRNTDDMW